MNTIHFNPTKLDRYADQQFEMASTLKSSGRPYQVQDVERMELAGIALRMWAEKVRAARKRAKRKASKE